MDALIIYFVLCGGLTVVLALAALKKARDAEYQARKAREEALDAKYSLGEIKTHLKNSFRF